MSNHRFCCCAGSGDPPLPPWVDPDGPGGPGGPQPPSNPEGSPRCCTGDTICSPNDSEAIRMGMRIVGSVSNNYQYGSGPNAGVPFSYSQDFNEVFIEDSGTSACQMTESKSFIITVPYVERSGDGTPVDRNIEIRIDSAAWNRERGFFGSSTDSGDNPVTNSFSGIQLTVGGGSGPIRGTNNSGYNLTWRICRSDTPALPPTERPDTYRLSQMPTTTLEQGTLPANSPELACLNRVVAEFSDSFSAGAGGDSNSISITYRLYLYVSRVAVCEPGI